MKLYLVTRTDNWSYDEYDSFVVAAENEENALLFHPNGKKIERLSEYDDNENSAYHYTYGWTSKENLKIEYIGESNSSEEKVILASFNAG